MNTFLNCDHGFDKWSKTMLHKYLWNILYYIDIWQERHNITHYNSNDVYNIFLLNL